MKIFAFLLASLLTVMGVIDNIATVNRLKKEAAEAFQSKDYRTAINHYRLLIDSLNVEDENIRVNLAHAYLMSGDTAAAQQNYGQLITSDNRQIKSVAYQQLGVVTSDKQQYKEALSFFKESLKANPSNEASRYDYELVKELLKQQQQQQEQQGDKPQDQKDQQQKQDQKNEKGKEDQKGEQGEQKEQGKEEQQSDKPGEEKQQADQAEEKNSQEGQQQKEGEKNEDEQSVSPVAEKLKEMNISEEKAWMILDAMRNNEMQYIQQNRRKATQSRDRSKPDW